MVDVREMAKKSTSAAGGGGGRETKQRSGFICRELECRWRGRELKGRGELIKATMDDEAAISAARVLNDALQCRRCGRGMTCRHNNDMRLLTVYRLLKQRLGKRRLKRERELGLGEGGGSS